MKNPSSAPVHEYIAKHAESTLRSEAERASFRLGKEISVGAREGVALPSMVVTPDKPNYARTQVPVMVNGEPVADLWVIAFRPGDSTGDYSDKFPKGSLKVPTHLQSNTGDRGLYPRPKSQLAEIALALAHAATPTQIFDGTSLSILTTFTGDSGNRVDFIPTDLFKITSSAGGHGVSSFITLGTDGFGRRVGDPHALLNTDLGKDSMDIVAFLAAESPEQVDLLASFNPTNPYTQR